LTRSRRRRDSARPIQSRRADADACPIRIPSRRSGENEWRRHETSIGFAAAAAASVALAASLAAGPLGAQELKISHQFKANADGRDLATRVFVEEVGKRDKNIKFRIYPGSSLGIKPVAQFDALQNGTLQMAVFPMSYATGKAHEFSAVILPGTIPNLDFAMKLRKSPYADKLQALAHKNGVHIVTWWWTPGGFASKEAPITGPKSVDGMKMRAADRLSSRCSRQRAHPWSTCRPPRSIRRCSGCAQRHLTSAETFVSMRLYEQTKFATVPGDYTIWMLMQPLVMSKQHWDKLTPQQQQKIFEEAAAKSDEFFLGLQREAGEKMAEAYTKAGGKVHQMTKDEFDQWLALARDTSWREFAAVSPEAKDLLDALLQAK